MVQRIEAELRSRLNIHLQLVENVVNAMSLWHMGEQCLILPEGLGGNLFVPLHGHQAKGCDF